MTYPCATMPDYDVRIVRTAEDVQEFDQWLRERLTVPLAIDTETMGLEWWSPQFCRLWQIGDDRSGWAIPVSWWGKVIEHAMSLIVDAGTLVVMHNAKFDMHAMETSGWPIPEWSSVIDTVVLMHLRRSDLPRSLKGKHTAELLGRWVYQNKTLLNAVGKEKYGLTALHLWQHIPVDEPAYWAYGVADTILTRVMYDQLLPTLKEFRPQVEREMHYMAIMYRAEKRGILVDENYSRALQDRLAREIERDLLYLRSQGIDNPNSNTQVMALLEEDYGFVPTAFTETGKPALDKNVLALLAKAGGMQTDVVEALVRFKRNTKWKGTYVDTFLTSADIHGRVHPSINTMAARTGRSSINGPALQTLPSNDPMIRLCLLPHKGDHWYSLDYSNQEPRTLAHYGRSERLLRYFTEGDGTGSVHDFVAGEMFGEGYTKEQRSLAKVMGLSRSYGAGAQTMAHASGLPLADVERLIPPYDELMGLASLNAHIGQIAHERLPNPYVVTHGGRRVYAEADLVYTLTNFIMQGSGADMLKDATIRLDYEGLADYILVPVHDEITFSFPKDEGAALAERARQIMQTDEFAVPMPVDIDGPGKSWGALYQ